MSSSTKIFIFKDSEYPMASEQSISDLQTLLSTDEIFGTRPDIQISNFNFNNLDGLQNPTFVVGGGSAMSLGERLKPIFTTIHASSVGLKYNYIGSCAGATIAPYKSEIFKTYTSSNPLNFSLPKYCITPSYLYLNPNCDIINDYKALVPFHPFPNYENQLTQNYVPYKLNLKLNDSGEFFPQLYLDGPAFKPLPNVEQNLTVVAEFSSERPFEFQYPQRQGDAIFYGTLPMIIAGRPNAQRGGRFLSGTHIEASVANSKFLGLFRQPTSQSSALSEADLKTFADEQENLQNTAVALLSNTFKPR